MSTEPTPERTPRFGIFRNWTSLTGLVIVMASLFSFILLFLLDSFAHVSNPYVGVLTYLVTPVFLFIGLGLVVIGVAWRRWRQSKTQGLVPAFQIDLGRQRDRRFLGYFLGGSALFLLITAVLS